MYLFGNGNRSAGFCVHIYPIRITYSHDFSIRVASEIIIAVQPYTLPFCYPCTNYNLISHKGGKKIFDMVFTYEPTNSTWWLVIHCFSMTYGDILHPLNIGHIVDVTVNVNNALWNGKCNGVNGRVRHEYFNSFDSCSAKYLPTNVRPVYTQFTL